MSGDLDHSDHLTGHPGQGYFTCDEDGPPVWHWAEPEPMRLHRAVVVAIRVALWGVIVPAILLFALAVLVSPLSLLVAWLKWSIGV